MNIAKITTSESLWYNVKSTLTKNQPDLSVSALEAIRETVLENFSHLIRENDELKQKLKFSTERPSCSGETRGIKRTLFPSSNETDSDELGIIGNLVEDDDKTDQHDDSNSNQGMFNKTTLEAELTEFKNICKVGVVDMTKSEDLDSIFGETTFDTFATNVRDCCPLLTGIIETLAIGKWSKYNKGKKTQSYKFKVALQMILALDDIKSQRTSTEFSTLFGILLISHGAGKAVIQALEPFGLCKGYDF